jgi:hypothetical protein
MATAGEGFSLLLSILDRMEIAYLVGGSVASSVHGISRPTMDVDLVADLRAEQVDEFCACLQGDFYADAAMIREALARGRSFNLIHLASSFKIDIFPLGRDPYSLAAFARREFERSHSFGPHPIECAVAAPEDTILRKLEWYRAGGETSERQWNDLRGVLKVSGARLDLAYLRKWAPYLKVEDLLDRLLAEYKKAE